MSLFLIGCSIGMFDSDNQNDSHPSDTPGPFESRLSIDPLSLDFGTSEETLTLLLENTGVYDVCWTIIENEAWVQCSDTTGTVPGGESVLIDVNAYRKYMPNGETECESNMEVCYNSTTENVYVRLCLAEDMMIVTGTVRDSWPDQPLAGATVILYRNDGLIASGETDELGEYWIENVPRSCNFIEAVSGTYSSGKKKLPAIHPDETVNNMDLLIDVP
jgi:hypothetical protein